MKKWVERLLEGDTSYVWVGLKKSIVGHPVKPFAEK
jgi:hypothetical protein